MAGDYFTWGELIESQAARRRPEVWAQQIDPPDGVLLNLRRLVGDVLDPLRRALGCPLTVSSGYRCPELNVIVQGADKSAHIAGRAADLKASIWLATDGELHEERATVLNGAIVQGRSMRDVPRTGNGWLWLAVVQWSHALKIDKAIHEFGSPGVPAWIHVQVSETASAAPREQFLRHDPAGGHYYERMTREEAICL